MTKKDLPINQSDDFSFIVGNTFKLIGKSWESLQLNFVTFLWIYLAPLIVISVGASFLARTFLDKNGFKDVSGETIAIGLIALLGLLFLGVVLAISAVITQLASVRGQKISFREVVDQAQPFFWRFIGLSILLAVIITLGFVLLIIPGFIAVVVLLFTNYLMIDKNLGVFDALKASYELGKKNWKIAAALLIVQAVIQIPSILAPTIGAFVTAILTVMYFCLPALLYVHITKGPTPARKRVSSKKAAKP